MGKNTLACAAAVIGALALLSLPALTTAAKAKPANDGRAQCYECHEEVKALKEGSRHASLSCATCHGKMDEHMKDPEISRPLTVIDQALCARCHKQQYDSFVSVNYEAHARMAHCAWCNNLKKYCFFPVN